MGGRPGDIFEIIQNRHIFLKFLFFLNIKKKKTLYFIFGFRGPIGILAQHICLAHASALQIFPFAATCFFYFYFGSPVGYCRMLSTHMIEISFFSSLLIFSLFYYLFIPSTCMQTAVLYFFYFTIYLFPSACVPQLLFI